VRPIEELLASLDPGGAPERRPAGSGPPAPPASRPATAPQKKKAAEPALSGAAGTSLANPSRPAVPASPSGAGAHPADDDPVQRFRAAVWDAGGMLGAAIAQATSLTLEEGGLRIAYAPALDAVRSVVERQENLATLRRCALGAVGAPVDVRIEPAEGARETPAAEAPPSAPPSFVGRSAERTADSASPPVGETGGRSLLDSARSEPGIRRLLAEFGAQVVEIRPLEVPRQIEPADAEAGGPEDSR
jgi:hypothetical protein